MKLQWNFVGLLAARGAKLTVGLAIIFLYARVFGVSATYDSWIWALGITNAVGMMAFGPITETVRASYLGVEIREGSAAADQYIATVAVLVICSAIFIGLGMALLLPALAEELVPQSSDHGRVASFFLYALAPSLALSQAVAVSTAHLNCRGRIYAPEIAGIIGGGIGFSFIIAFPDLPAIWLLLGSYYLTLTIPLVAATSFWPTLLSSLSKLEYAAFVRHAREVISLSVPLLIPYGFGQILAVLELQYALQAGTGILSILSYAFFAKNTVQAIFSAALSALAVPALVREWEATDLEPFRLAFRNWVHQCMILVTVGMIILYGFSDLVPSLLFGKNITLDNQVLLGKLLRYYAVAMMAVVLFLVAGAGLLAARRARTYAVYSAIACVCSILLLLMLFPRVGIVAIPVGLTVSHFFAASLMLRAINPNDVARVMVSASARMIVIMLAGSALNKLDFVLTHRLGIMERSAACVLSALVLLAIWWIIEHRLLRRSIRFEARA